MDEIDQAVAELVPYFSRVIKYKGLPVLVKEPEAVGSQNCTEKLAQIVHGYIVARHGVEPEYVHVYALAGPMHMQAKFRDEDVKIADAIYDDIQAFIDALIDKLIAAVRRKSRRKSSKKAVFQANSCQNSRQNGILTADHEA